MPAPLAPAAVERIRELRFQHGLTAREVSGMVGCSEWTARHYAPGRPGKVPVAPLRAEFLRSGLSAYEVARRAGWFREDTGRPDQSRVRRVLGLKDDSSGSGHRSRRTLADAETIATLAEAIGVAPWAVIQEPSCDPPIASL